MGVCLCYHALGHLQYSIKVPSAESCQLEGNQGCGKHGGTTLEVIRILSAQGGKMAFCTQSLHPKPCHQELAREQVMAL